jgi:hypothetical protein
MCFRMYDIVQLRVEAAFRWGGGGVGILDTHDTDFAREDVGFCDMAPLSRSCPKGGQRGREGRKERRGGEGGGRKIERALMLVLACVL